MSMIVFPVILHVKLWYQTVAFVAHILSHVICQICWFLAQTKPSPNLPSEPNISGCSTFFSMLVHNSCRVCHCIPRCNLCVMAAQCVYRRESAGWSRMISFGAQLVESTSALLKFLPVKWVLICRDSLQACINVSTEGTEKKYKTLNSTGWMRINCRCLDGLNPLSRVRDLAAIESEKWKKNPLGVFVSLTVDAAVVCLWLSICHGLWCWGIGPGSLLTLPHPFITHASIYLSPPSIHPPIPFLHVSPTGFEMFVSSLSLSTPPPPALVATETADSGRVGGCLRALAALPHAVLSQYISASVLLLWPWYADSSGGSVRCYTIVSGTQRLFVPFPQRTCWVFRVVLPFTSVFPQMTEQTEEKRLTNHRDWEVFLYNVLLCWICAHIIYVSDVNAWLLTGLLINCWADPVRR